MSSSKERSSAATIKFTFAQVELTFFPHSDSGGHS